MNSTYGDCSKPKKSKTSEEASVTSYWAHLPSLILCDIFDLLTREDRRNASAVCKNWRQNSFHPKWFNSVTFRIEHSNLERAHFQIYTFGSIAMEIKIIINSLSYECVEEFVHLLEEMQKNNNLKTFIIEPTHCRLEMPILQNSNRSSDEYKEILNLTKNCLSKLKRFSIGCLEDFSLQLEELLESLNPSLVTHLGLATVKDIPFKQEGGCFDSKLIAPFTKLKILSVDYDQISDDFLSKLDGAMELKRLVVHLHGVRLNHPGTTNNAWMNFSEKHPNCEFRLTVIHAFNDIRNLHETVMRQSMPLSHLRVLFCEQSSAFYFNVSTQIFTGSLELLVSVVHISYPNMNIHFKVNMELIEDLTHYSDTLRSVIWVDSLSDNHSSWTLIKPWYDNSPDPFVLTAWLCKRLEELVLLGYKYWRENLIAIGRLRGHTLKRLEIAEVDVHTDSREARDPIDLDIPHCTSKPWRPLKKSELHPVVRSPTAGDSDEYLLPLVLADLN